MARIKPRRWILFSIAALVLIAVGLVWVRAADGPAQAAPAAPAPAIAPIQDPAVQHWLWNLDRHQVELNDSLILLVQHKATRANCARINASVHAIEGLGHNPNAEVDKLIFTGFDKFQQAALACLRGDWDSAYQLADQGLAERAPAALELDEVLEGE